MKKKKQKKKKPALRSTALTKQEQKKIANHEDIALKATAQFFRDEIMPMLNIEGKVVSIFPTEKCHKRNVYRQRMGLRKVQSIQMRR